MNIFGHLEDVVVVVFELCIDALQWLVSFHIWNARRGRSWRVNSCARDVFVGLGACRSCQLVGSNPAGGFRFPLVDFPYESRGCGPQIRAGRRHGWLFGSSVTSVFRWVESFVTIRNVGSGGIASGIPDFSFRSQT